jgi:hypothetical protein
MSRRRPVSGATISLFPFLAVLLCTMGALLVLLVIFSRRAKESETAASLAAEQGRAEELEMARDELRWRLEQLEEVRGRTADDLARERMRLAGVEEDARKLADELDALERTAAALERDTPAAGGEAAVADAERRLAEARAALDKARADGATKPAAYAVVPYEGVHGTHRRPLYVECCIDGVFLQPEGIRLGPADFEGPPGPGNPLASALRAAREHLAKVPGESGDPATQPYPLLLVRPSGVMAYYAARESLTSWGSEFGYQFVDEDWQLKYPPADPALADVEQRAIDESRRRLEWLAQVRPARPVKPTQQYRASTTRGGVVAEGGPSVLGDQSRFDWTAQQANAGGRGGVPGGRGDGVEGGRDDAGGGDVVLGGGGRGRGGNAAQGGQGGAGGGGGDRYAGPSRFYAGAPAESGGPGAGGPGAAGGQHANGSSMPTADGGSAVASGGPGGGAAAGDLAGSTGGAGGDQGEEGGAASGAGAGSAGRFGSASGAAGAGAGATGSTASMGGGSAGAGNAGGGPSLPGMPQPIGASASVGGSASGSLAGARGSNWASLATAERPIPLTRPIRVECAADEFRIFDDGGTRVETRIPIGTRTADSVDLLVQTVHGRVGRWGLAGDRMYWRPELVLSEAAGGRTRREDLEKLLADSGLDTRRSGSDMEVRRLPPVTRTSAMTTRR